MTRRSIIRLGLALALIAATFDGFAAGMLMISQRKRSFSVEEVAIHRGDTLDIVNDDLFTHQVYVDSPSFKFDSDESNPGSSIKLTFTEAGTFVVQCHIHPKMHLQVTVQ